MTEQCGNCRFRHGASAKFDETFCRRFPPTPRSGWFGRVTSWPEVRWNAWCGEHQPEFESGRKPISPKEYRHA